MFLIVLAIISEMPTSEQKGEGEVREYLLDRVYEVELQVEIPAQGLVWFVVEAGV